MKRVKLAKTLPYFYSQYNQANPLRENGRTRHYVLRKEEEEFSVAKMRYISTGNIEPFYLRLMLLEMPIDYFRD